MSALATRRLMSEYKKIKADPSSDFITAPVSDSDLFTWNFIIKGPRGTAFEGGIYQGKIVFPPEYPTQAPDILFSTPNGRFEVNTKICLNITSYHNESWSFLWSARTILEALMMFLPTPYDGGIGAINMTDEEKVNLAKQSRSWKSSDCNLELLPDPLPM